MPSSVRSETVVNPGSEDGRRTDFIRETSSSTWIVAGAELDLSRRPFLVGVLNVTPDSFYDRGAYGSPDAAIARARALIAEGVDALDIGAESTRPGADDVSAAIQIRRLSPVIRALRDDGVPISIDTRSAMVAAAMLEIGAVLVNDVSGLSDPAMSGVVAEYEASLILMHSRGVPKTMQVAPRYGDVIAEVAAFLKERLERAVASGISFSRIALDPGIGFGKRPGDNLALIANADQLLSLGRPLLLGVSRKSFLGALGAGEAPADRLAGSLAASVVAWSRGVRIFRTHDPAETRRALATVIALESASSGLPGSSSASTEKGE